RGLALVVSIPTLILAIAMFYTVQSGTPDADGFFFVYSTEWFPQLGANWHLGVDGVAASMVLLTAILTPLAILIAFEHTDNPRAVLALSLFLHMAMTGVIATRDMLAFFGFWELGLVPLYYIISQ